MLKSSESQVEEDQSSVTTEKGKQMQEYAKSKPKILRYLIYGVINVIGVLIGIYGLYSCVKSVSSWWYLEILSILLLII